MNQTLKTTASLGLTLASLLMAAVPASAQSGPEPTLIASVRRALASEPGTLTPPTLAETWRNVDAWTTQQRTQAGARAAQGVARFLPPHLRDQNALTRYAESKLLLLPQRDVKHAEGAALKAGAFTLGKAEDVAFAGRDESPDSALGVVVEFQNEVAFAGDLPDAGRRGEVQAQNLGALINAVNPSQPTKITLVPLSNRPDAQVAEIRRALSEAYAGVPIAVNPAWP